MQKELEFNKIGMIETSAVLAGFTFTVVSAHFWPLAMTAVLAPHTVRLNTSNPPTVVPQMCLDEGAACVGNDTPSASLICEYP